MPCPTCGTTDARTQVLPGYWRCDAVVDVDRLVGAPPAGGPPTAAPASPGTRTCGTNYVELTTGALESQACRCGLPPIGECSECGRAVCEEHSTLWRGWRVCDRDLANARMRARAAAVAEERRAREAAAAAEAERQRQRTTLLEMTDEEALWLLYVPEPRTEQEIRSAVHALHRVPADEFTQLCVYVLDHVQPKVKTRRRGLRRLSGWPFAGPQYHDRSWFLTAKGEWYRSGSYGHSGAEQGHRGKRVRLDDTEKRAVIYDMSWQQSQSGTSTR
jgi:hypothetical protein